MVAVAGVAGRVGGRVRATARREHDREPSPHPVRINIIADAVNCDVDGGASFRVPTGKEVRPKTRKRRLTPTDAGKPVRHRHSPRYCDRGRRGTMPLGNWEGAA